jgi:hypothetical protein
VHAALANTRGEPGVPIPLIPKLSELRFHLHESGRHHLFRSFGVAGEKKREAVELGKRSAGQQGRLQAASFTRIGS